MPLTTTCSPNDGDLNIAFEAVDRHVVEGRGEHIALRCLHAVDAMEPVSYTMLANDSNRFAHLLQSLGVVPGDVVCTVLGSDRFVFATALACWKAKAVFCALFAAFGPEPLQTRLTLGNVRVLVTTVAVYRRRIEPLRASLPDLRHVLITDADELCVPDGTVDLRCCLAGQSSEFTIPPTPADTPALLHFTSGTTGTPKGAIHVHGAVLEQRDSARLTFGLQHGDVYWCTADPGWITGVVYGVIAPLCCGATVIVDAREFDSHRWLQTLSEQAVDIWYTAPTALRLLMRMDEAAIGQFTLARLRCIGSVGEPLSADAVAWSERVFGLPVQDTWWQTETGAIMVANRVGNVIKPGSMGRPLPGIEVAVARRRDDGAIDRLASRDSQGVVGELALRRGWPAMFRDYLDQPERYRQCFVGDWYLSGDLVRQDDDGYLWFVGRSDDVIKTAGHLVGPFEVERVLLTHPSVVNAAVVGLPDPVLGEKVKAFVVPTQERTADAELRRELLAYARKRLGAIVAPRDLEFCNSLPQTRSGKLVRRMLKARALGQSPGDTSTVLPQEH